VQNDTSNLIEMMINKHNTTSISRKTVAAYQQCLGHKAELMT